MVTSYKYLGIIIDQNLSFKTHIQRLVSKLKLKLGYFFRNQSCFSLQVRKHLIHATFLPLLDYGDLLFMNAPAHYLKRLDTVYNCALRFITGYGNRVHHCSLYAAAKCPSLHIRRLSHWLIFIYKYLLGLVPSYLCVYMCKNHNQYSLRSHNIIQLIVPKIRTELGKKAFKYAAPASWNNLQKELKLSELVTLGEFKSVLKERENSSFTQCDCF